MLDLCKPAWATPLRWLGDGLASGVRSGIGSVAVSWSCTEHMNSQSDRQTDRDTQTETHRICKRAVSERSMPLEPEDNAARVGIQMHRALYIV